MNCSCVIPSLRTSSERLLIILVSCVFDSSVPPWYPGATRMDTNGTGALPLDGVRVLELGHIIAGPSAGLLLAALGADVVKVERAGDGDSSRALPAGSSALFHFLHRNKRSIALDLKGSAEGRELFLRLVE